MQTALFKTNIISKLKNPGFILGTYLLVAVIASLASYLQGHKFEIYTHYNNYLIFKYSFNHLIHNLDLYATHEPEHFDLYKYSPAFAIAMAPFTVLPDLPGLILWNLLNALVLFFAIKTLPIKNDKATVYILWFVLLELLTSMQSSQSNGLIAGLMILGLNKFEKGNVFLASLFILLSAYIKIYGLLALVLFVFYPRKARFILYTLLWIVILTFIPLLFVSFSQLIFLYKSWYGIVALDRATQYGTSLLGLIHSWFGAEPNKDLLMFAGLIILLLPLIHIKKYSDVNFRLNFLALLLIWLIIFNHRAESPTYIVAVAGIAIWYFNSPKAKFDMYLIIFAFILTSLSNTDLFPHYLQDHFVKPYVLKALPCVIIWIRIVVQLITDKPRLLENKNEGLDAVLLKK